MKAKRFFIVLLLFIPLVGIAQCEAIVYWKYQGEIALYEKPDGKQIMSLKNDQEQENYLSMKILEETDHFFEVSISYEMSKVSYQGWIKKGKYIGALARNEQEHMTLTLYDQPDQRKAQKTELKRWKSQFITIITCSSKWILIEVDYNGKRTTGWIPSEKLCANNYSTCS